jgi:PAS domain S-box-containing protein
LLVESVQDYAIFMLDPAGHVVTWNAGARRIKGYETDEIVGKHFSIFYLPQDAKHGKPDYGLRVAADEGRWEEEGWRRRKDGSRFWASVVITALRDEAGRIVAFAKVTRDLTERKRAEDAQRALLAREKAAREAAEVTSERLKAFGALTEAALAHLGLPELLRAMLDRVVDLLEVDTAALLLLEGDMLVARAARGLEEDVEGSVRIPIGKGFAGQVAAERRTVILEDVEHADLINPVFREKGIKALLGTPLVVGGRVLGVIHVGTLYGRRFTEDDAQLLQVAADRVAMTIEHERLSEAERSSRLQAEAVALRDEFLSVAAHELKTPMTGLKLVVQHLLRRLDQGALPDLGDLRRELLRVDQQANKASRLVAQLLETSRLEAGRLVLDRRVENVSEVVASAVEHARIRTSQHELVLSAPPNVPASVDALRLEQVVTNLLDNAIKFSPKGRRIEVEVSTSVEGTVRLVVRDHGLGIPPEQEERIFDRFHQVHADEHRSGLGIGLYVSRGIVELHGGRITVESPPDGGARFVVTLPTGLEADSPRREGNGSVSETGPGAQVQVGQV